MFNQHHILKGHVYHCRHSPKKYSFNHKVNYFILNINQLSRLKKYLFLGYNSSSLIAFNDNDHIPSAINLNSKEWVDLVLEKHKFPIKIEHSSLITIPKLFGYVFNPVSFWLLYDKDKQLKAVIAEVNNTFNERHCYLLHRDQYETIKDNDLLSAEKAFYVSPFLKVTGHYQFKFDIKESKISIAIHHYQESKKIYTATLKGPVRSLTSWQLFNSFLSKPLNNIKVTFLIHYHALFLKIKGIQWVNKPEHPPKQEY